MGKVAVAVIAALLVAGLALPAFQPAGESNCGTRQDPVATSDSKTPCDIARVEKTNSYTVYRHHPGMLPDIEDRNHDHELIFTVYQRSTNGSSRIHGGLGRGGYAYELSADNIPIWLSGVTTLLSSGKLKHYSKFGFDENGLGLEKPENLPRP